MSRRLRPLVLLAIITLEANCEPDLPLCPMNIQYFPQSLPMHCKMPPGGPVPYGSNPLPPKDMPPTPPPDYNSPPPDKMPPPIPFPIPPGFPAPIFPPPAIPLMPGPPPPHKLPVIVMPFYSPDPAFIKKQREKKRQRNASGKNKSREEKRKELDRDTDSDASCSDASSGGSSSSSDSDDFWRFRRGMRKRSHRRKHDPRRGKRRHTSRRSRMRQRSRRSQGKPDGGDLLTPLIQYVTKDGYVIYEKEISKNEAKDWLNVAKEDDKKVSFQELDDLNKKYPGDGTGDAEALSAAELERNKFEFETEVQKVEQELIQERNQESTIKPHPPKLKKWRRKSPKSRKQKFAEKIGTNVETLT